MNYTKTNRRDFLKSTCLSVVSLTIPQYLNSAARAANRTNNARPNFIIFIADDQAWNDVGCYGHPSIRTPNIDKLAKDGIKFEYAFLTCASCSPTRCSVITGRYPHSTGARELHQSLPANQIAFPGLLKQAGYYTAMAGKWHLGQDAKKNFDMVARGGGPSSCEKWVDTLKNRPKDKPFFMWFASVDPHRPYSPNTIDEPHKPEDVVVPPFLPDVPETRKDLAMYYDEITRMDDFIGQVLKELDKQSVAENTFVLFFSDNGRPFPRCKTTIYDSGVRTPLIVRWPKKVKTGTVCSNLVSVVDIAPTICELARVELSSRFQGKSFAPLLADPNKSIREYIFAEHNWHDYQAHERAVRSKQYLYIRNSFPKLPGTPPADAVRGPTFQNMRKLRNEKKLPPHQMTCFVTPRPAEELYDVQKDPHSMNNLSYDPIYEDVLKKMRKVFQNWSQETDDWIPRQPTPDQFDRETGLRLKLN